MERDIILSLCDHSGNWSKPYEENSFKVIRVDLKDGQDARLWPSLPSKEARFPRQFTDIRQYLGRVYGILAAPVCTAFSGAGAKHPRTDEEILEGLALVDACVRLAFTLKPVFFALENPVGKLTKWLGEYQMTFQPCDYGDPYKKRTCLYGWFNTDLKKSPVEPHEGSKMWARYGGKSEKTKEARSITPMGFSQAFYEANHD